MDEKRYRIYLCAGLHCTPAGRGALLRVLEDALWDAGLDSAVEVRSSSCLNRCEFAPNLTVWPGPVRYANLTPERVRRIVAALAASQAAEELVFHEE